MNVYIETNFVLELALLQEQQSSCEQIVALAEEHAVQLVMPAYCLTEPYETLIRRHKNRKRIKSELDTKFRQLERSTSYVDRLAQFEHLCFCHLSLE